MESSLKITLVGEVDHGKSTLIGRLLHDLTPAGPAASAEGLASAVDGFVEERQGLFTLDTTQATLNLGPRRMVFIDVPGHLELLKNMMTGASQAQAALVVVDVSQGIREQTRRHLALLSMLGVSRCVIACNKMDAVGYRPESFHSLAQALGELLGQLRLECREFVPISALEGENISASSQHMEWYKGPPLVQALKELSSALLPGGSVRFPIQDIYDRRGRRLFAGRVESGELRAGMELKLYPEGWSCRVEAIERFGEPPLQRAAPGECVGLYLEAEPAPRRGQVLASESTPPLVGSLLSAGVVHLGGEPLLCGERLSFRCASREIGCRVAVIERCINTSTFEVSRLERQEVRFSESAELRLVLDEPMVCERFCDSPSLGRFILSRSGNVVACGIVHGLDQEVV